MVTVSRTAALRVDPVSPNSGSCSLHFHRDMRSVSSESDLSDQRISAQLRGTRGRCFPGRVAPPPAPPRTLPPIEHMCESIEHGTVDRACPDALPERAPARPSHRPRGMGAVRLHPRRGRPPGLHLPLVRRHHRRPTARRSAATRRAVARSVVVSVADGEAARSGLGCRYRQWTFSSGLHLVEV